MNTATYTLTLPVFNAEASARVVFIISLLLWVLALVSYIIAFVNYNKTNDQKRYNFWLVLGSLFVWLQLFTILALAGTPMLFSRK